MRFLIIGAGALGGYFGAKLARSGADVSFLLRPRRAALLAEGGLAIRDPEGDFSVPVKAVSAGAAGGPYDVVLLACKAYDLDGAIDDFAPALAPGGAILPILNGLRHIDRLKERLGAARVLGGTTTVHAGLTAEGGIVHFADTAGETAFGEIGGERSARCAEIGRALAAGGLKVTVADDIVARMWGKFSAMAAIGAIASLTRARAGEVAATAAGPAFAAAATEECARVSTAAGYPPPPAIRDFVLGLYTRIGSEYVPSILADLEAGRPTEGEHIVGDMVARADRLGIEAPILRAALCNLQVYEARRRAAEQRR